MPERAKEQVAERRSVTTLRDLPVGHCLQAPGDTDGLCRQRPSKVCAKSRALPSRKKPLRSATDVAGFESKSGAAYNHAPP
jgi:hypothetical protein